MINRRFVASTQVLGRVGLRGMAVKRELEGGFEARRGIESNDSAVRGLEELFRARG